MLRKTWIPSDFGFSEQKGLLYRKRMLRKPGGFGFLSRKGCYAANRCSENPRADRSGGGPDSLSPVIWVVAPLHVLSALTLMFLVLLHSGKGGGLSDMFGGGLGAQAAGSTVVERNLDRITIVAALVFAFASVSYALII